MPVRRARAQTWAADDKTDPKPNPTIDLADGNITLTAPDGWVRKTPKVRFIDHEFAVSASKGDTEERPRDRHGRRGHHRGQLRSLDQSVLPARRLRDENQIAEADRKKTIAGLEVRFVDLAGTYKDMPRPFDPNGGATARKDYRMVAAIIASPKLGNYFIKFYGPKQTVADHTAEFRKMVDGLKVK